MINLSKPFNILGIMSGTSLDGLDLALCSFWMEGKDTRYAIERAETISYDRLMKEKLSGSMVLTGEQLTELDHMFGGFIGEQVNMFLDRWQLHADLIASHGHTVFHRPAKGFTLQIGNGAAIFAKTGLPVVFDFRSLDVALGGQGAPLVPIGDRSLFSDHDLCLNLGGIANISYDNAYGERTAFDICAANMVINKLALSKGAEMDLDGAMGARGILDPKLLSSLNEPDFYQLPAPRSLGKEDVDHFVQPLIDASLITVEDKIHTFCHHIAMQIRKATMGRSGKMLVTGGGAFNKFLMEVIRSYNDHLQVVVPDKEVVAFKEALIFAFLGYLRMQGLPNCLRSVTGASNDNCGGSLIGWPNV